MSRRFLSGWLAGEEGLALSLDMSEEQLGEVDFYGGGGAGE
jgi:hypothetical protein